MGVGGVGAVGGWSLEDLENGFKGPTKLRVGARRRVWQAYSSADNAIVPLRSSMQPATAGDCQLLGVLLHITVHSYDIQLTYGHVIHITRSTVGAGTQATSPLPSAYILSPGLHCRRNIIHLDD